MIKKTSLFLQNFFQNYKIELFLFFLALVLRLIFFSISLYHTYHGDLLTTIHGQDGYFEISQNLIKGNGYSSYITPPYKLNPLRTPIYNYFLAYLLILTHSYFWTIFIQIILGSFIPVLVYWCINRIIKNQKQKVYKTVSFWTSLIIACEPNFILLSYIFYTETLFIFLFLIFILFLLDFLESKQLLQIVAAGIMLGLATLTKPTTEYFPIILVLIFLWHFRKDIKFWFLSSILFGISFLIIVFPWLYRNHQVYGVWGFSSQPVFNLYMYVVPSAEALESGQKYAQSLNNFVASEHFQGKEITLANEEWFKLRALELIKQHPKGTLEIIPISLITFFTHDGMLSFLGFMGINQANIISVPSIKLILHPVQLIQTLRVYMLSPYILILLFRIFWALVTILALVEVIKIIKTKKLTVQHVIIILLIAYFALTTIDNGLGVNARFRLPVEPFMVMYAFSLITVYFSKFAAKRKQ